MEDITKITDLIAHIHESLAKAQTLGPPDDLYKQKKYNAYHITSWAQKNEIDPSYSIRKMLEELYSEAYQSISDLSPEEGKSHENIDLFYKALETIPQSLPDKQIIWNEDWEYIQLDLWELFEGDHEISFGLGDDGTDEMQQEMGMIYHLLKYSKTQYNIDYPWHWLQRALIINEFNLNDQDEIYISMDHLYSPDDHIALLNLMHQSLSIHKYMDKGMRYILDHITEQYDLDKVFN